MNPDHGKIVSEFLLRSIESEIPRTTSVFAALPADRLDHKPDELSKTALGLMRHIALEDVYFLEGIAAGGFGPLPDDSDGCGLMNPEDCVAQYSSRMTAAIATLRARSGEDMVKDLTFMGGWTMPAIQFLSMAAHHSVHHRGQLTTYIRAMGGKVPSIYGPSADTAIPAAAGA
jgi:uncharacterized damage-inducible protein DinB